MRVRARSLGIQASRWATCLLVASTLAPATADALVQGRSLTVTDFDARYRVRTDAKLEVEERITFRFDGSWNGVYRWIPVVYNLDDGGRLRIYLDLEPVVDGDGNELRHEVERDGAVVKIKTWVPDAQDTQRTVIYRYTVDNGLRYFRDEEGLDWDHDELYWNATGHEWEIPILSASATVELPPGATGVQATAYTGAFGARGEAYRSSIDGTTIRFETTRTLKMREGLTIVVGWDAGAVNRPAAVDRARWFLLDYIFLPLPFLAFGFMFWLWRKKGRDPELDRSIMPRYEPPDGMRPAEIGTLMDFQVDSHDISATILDLAVRGYIKIEEVPGRILPRPRDHIIHILKDPKEATALESFESEVLDGLFALAEHEPDSEFRRSVKVSELKKRFYKHLPDIKKKVYARLLRQPRMFTARPDRVKGVWTGIATAVGVGCFMLGIYATDMELGLPAVRWASLIATPLSVLGFGVLMPARTLRGARTLNHVLGLREYIDRVDRHRLQYATLEHFETLLPYAAAMKLEEKWTDAFEGILMEPPNWYVSHHTGRFHAHHFSSSVGRMTDAAGTAISSAPRSSSSGSGFSSGGFSGGGGGGGGGGGF